MAKRELELFEKLLLGSSNLNQMKRDIQTTISIVLGFIKAGDLPEDWDSIDHVIQSGKYEWRLQLLDTRQSQIIVHCWINDDGRYLAYSSNAEHLLKMENIQTVYRGLETFVYGMNGLFPFLMQRWQPLINAAEV